MTEWILWATSVTVTVVFFCVFGGSNLVSLFATIVGVTALTFIAKGNPIGQLLTIVFSVMYATVSYSYRYYGEMITYMCMSVPMATVALIGWIRNPYGKNHAEVEVNRLPAVEIVIIPLITAAVTVAFYFILQAFGTANLIPSTVSVATSFAASYLVFRRSRFFALVYAANDVVLIVLWSLAVADDISYIATLVCFVAFFAHDIYSFINWRRIQKRQSAAI